MKRILTLIGSIFFALQFRLYADIAVYEPSVVTEKMVIDTINHLIPLILLLIGLGIALILLCYLLRYLRSKKRERAKAGSAEKTEKKKILDPMECIVIALLLSAVCVVAVGMFGSSIARVLCYFQQNLGETRVELGETRVDLGETIVDLGPVQKPVFQGPCKICGYTNDDEIVSLRHECYYCKKCQETHSYTIYNKYLKAFWCYNCCMVGGERGRHPEIKHCCKCQQNHGGPCEDEERKEVWSWSSVNLQWTRTGGRLQIMLTRQPQDDSDFQCSW